MTTRRDDSQFWPRQRIAPGEREPAGFRRHSQPPTALEVGLPFPGTLRAVELDVLDGSVGVHTFNGPGPIRLAVRRKLIGSDQVLARPEERDAQWAAARCIQSAVIVLVQDFALERRPFELAVEQIAHAGQIPQCSVIVQPPVSASEKIDVPLNGVARLVPLVFSQDEDWLAGRGAAAFDF